jgi:hypothetical protein
VPVASDYHIFVHFRSASGGRFYADHAPARGMLPMRFWRPGEVVRDDFEVEVPADVPAGIYGMEVGLREAARNRRVSPGWFGASQVEVVKIEVR